MREHRQAAPGLLEGLIVTGSAIAGDWWPGTSDVDLVLVVSRVPTPTELEACAALHSRSIADGPIDGIYVTREQIEEGPDRLGSAVQVVEGILDPDATGGQISWVTWREIESGWEAVAGDDGVGEWAWSSWRFPQADDGARAFSRANLSTYWEHLGRQARLSIADRPAGDPVDARTVRWIALGPARLVATMETGEILSKSAAAGFASERWPRYRDLLARVVSSRHGGDDTFTVADAASALDLLDDCVAASRTP
ncbi:uncharacterized protein DUF4111 [Labedella gwakjiensis]|uniref:Uncharacterized protein DUF4111 n=1 Tax=Labedella gwakjiensis TaxID=390269 RepID=A0A2P8GZA2_9MICO|nr:DUF4111 domain-containing protein [Labedella gwakjiensis]PSL39285.1 uncharacterized protein DUF4111 [Labedella gwakjiensis]